MRPITQGGHLHHNTNYEYLSDYTSQPWDQRRSSADDFAMVLRAYGLTERATRVEQCARFLRFAWTDDGKLKPYKTYFCRVRLCPVCEWRRAMMWRARLYDAFPKLWAAYPTGRLIFLTLTVRNVSVGELGRTLTEMARGWRRLTGRDVFKRAVLGWFKTTEVTRGRGNTAHPHYHVVLFVKASYFGSKYIKQSDWVRLWREAMRLDYQPVVDVRAVRCGGIVPEVAKYAVKPTDLTDEDVDRWIIAVAHQLHGRRLIGSSGLFRQVLAELEAQQREQRALETDSHRQPDLTFLWDKGEMRYKLYPLPQLRSQGVKVKSPLRLVQRAGPGLSLVGSLGPP